MARKYGPRIQTTGHLIPNIRLKSSQHLDISYLQSSVNLITYPVPYWSERQPLLTKGPCPLEYNLGVPNPHVTPMRSPNRQPANLALGGISRDE